MTQPVVAARASALLLAVLAGSASAATADGRPDIGRHAGELCVATSAAAPSCGSVQVELRRDGSARLRFDDIVYQLQLHSSQVEVVLMHGTMQIDEFTVPYEWVGGNLQFKDDERGTRYEVRFTKRSQNEPVR